MKKKGFRYGTYKDKRKADNRVIRPRPVPEDEGLTGFVRGLKASDIEERFARALNKYRVPFEFQVFIPSNYSFPGEAKEMDFIVRDQPVNVHGYIGHFHTSGQKWKDRVRDLMIDEVLVPKGYKPVKTVVQSDLDNQDIADMTVRRIFA